MATQKGRNWSSGDIVTAANLSSVERGVSAVSSLYEPTTWANGDTVTAAALNNIEQGIVNADGGGKSWVTLCEEEVTTETTEDENLAILSYSQLISTDTIRVTFDGTEYMCENISSMAGIYGYGGMDENGLDFSEYPFAIISRTSPKAGVVNQIITETSGTHTVKIEALQESGSSDFSTAQVTIVNNAPDSVSFNLSLAITMSEGGMAGTLGGMSSYQIGSGMVANAVLYKGIAGMELKSFDEYDFNIEASGDAQVMGHNCTITGDCTITISDSLQ